MLSAVGLSTHIYNNHFKSILLLIGFPFLLILMLGGFFGALVLFAPIPGQPPAMNWPAAGRAAMDGITAYGHYAILAAAVWMVIAYFFHGSMMRMATHSRPVTRAEMPEIYNLLENLCIAQGVTMPKFEIIESSALNAFASGINDKTYTIVLTTGIIQALSSDELEGVIAHELTHIINRDVRLLIISVIFVGMISFFAEMAFRSLVYGRSYRSSNSREGRGGQLIVMLIAMLILAVGYVLALAIRFALSRKREYLADAGAVEMTKNPDAMMRALMRISGQDRMSGIPDEVEQMCIENSKAFMGVFATHPPINDRIEAISRMTATPVPVFNALTHKESSPWT